MKIRCFFILLLFIVISVLYKTIAQDTSVIVTDLRITLLNVEQSKVDKMLFLEIIRSAEFIKQVNETLDKTINGKFKQSIITVDEEGIVFLKGFDSQPLHYKEMKNSKYDFYMIFESNVGLAEVMKEEAYDVVTSVKVMDSNKKKVFKNIASVPIEMIKDSEGNSTGKYTKQAFLNAYFRSLELVFITESPEIPMNEKYL